MPTPISVICPDCGTKWKAPESAIGTKVRCPDCETAVKVRDPDAAVSTRRTGRRRDEDDDPDERRRRRDRERGDRPANRSARSKAGRGRKRGRSPVLWVAVGVGALALLGGGGALVYVLTSKDKGTGSADGTDKAAPGGWKEIGDPATGFRMLMPGAPVRQVRPGNVPGAVAQPVRWGSITGDGTHTFTVVVFDFGRREFPTDAVGLRRLLEELDSTALWGEKTLAQREIPVGGRPGAELELAPEDPTFGFNEHKVIRLVGANGKFYVLLLSAVQGKFDAQIRSRFFDSFRLG